MHVQFRSDAKDKVSKPSLSFSHSRAHDPSFYLISVVPLCMHEAHVGGSGHGMSGRYYVVF